MGWGLCNAPFGWDLGFLPNDSVAVDAIPDLGENQQIIYTPWEGRSPQDIDDQITYPLTTALMGIPGVKTIRSSSMFGFSTLYIIFEDDVEFYWSRSRILEKLNALPAHVLPNGVSPTLGPDATGLGQVFWYTLEGRDAQGMVTGGWDLYELRSIQDYQVKHALASVYGVAEVASVGGFVQEYQIDVDPEQMKHYGVALSDVVQAVKTSNRDIGAKTIEINQVEYLVRGLGAVRSISDIENTVVQTSDFTSIVIKDIARVALGPAIRRGVLDKGGAEVVGGAVVARYQANPMKVIAGVKQKIEEISKGLPSKVLKDGRVSQLTIVPFYDRSVLIQETLHTLEDALTLELLITILVVVLMIFNLRAALMISGVLPIAILLVFIAMKAFGVDANIVALSGIAIAIGTMVDIGVILSENMIRHLDKAEEGTAVNKVVYEATTEVSGAILTAVLTTIVSFMPVFIMIGAEGKLFRPLAFTKTMALLASVLVALFLMPSLAAFLFKRYSFKKKVYGLWNLSLMLFGLGILIYGHLLGLAIFAFGVLGIFKWWYQRQPRTRNIQTRWDAIQRFLFLKSTQLSNGVSALVVVMLLAVHWHPLGIAHSLFWNFIFVAVVCFGLLVVFFFFRKNYVRLLTWTLEYKLFFMLFPILLITLGIGIWRNTGQEFMPALDEGDFLLMPTGMPHAGIAESKRILQQLDMAVAQIPEVAMVVGKAGRMESALDPAPLSMYENIIRYKPEYMVDSKGEKIRFKVDKNGLFETTDGRMISNGNNKVNGNSIPLISDPRVQQNQLIVDPDGAFYRNWRPHIKSPDDIWTAISKATQLPGVTTAPKLQPIQTRLIMLQTGMRAPMGIKIKGQNLAQIEAFGWALEQHLKTVDGVKKEAVFTDRMIGKPYINITIDRGKLVRYGVHMETVQSVLETALGGKVLTQTIEGRARYGIRVRYPRALRDHPETIAEIYVPLEDGNVISLKELATIDYEQGPQVIKSEDTFLVGYVLFDKDDAYAEITVIENAKALLQNKIAEGSLVVPAGISYEFTGAYQHQLRASKTLSLIIPMALGIIFLILYLQFRAIGTSLFIFVGIAVAFAGGFVMLWCYGQDWFLNIDILGTNLRTLFGMHSVNLSVAVWVGFIALFGIATDDGVLMATYLTQVFQKNTPKTVMQIRLSVIAAGEQRIRPCLMTTATTLLALLPVLTSTGRGSDIMIPMAIPVFGGMVFALITLFVVPVLFCWKEEFKIRRM